MIQGSLATMSPWDIFDWLARRKLSGQLVVERGDVNRRLQIAGGVVTRTASSHPAERLGQMVIGAGYISDEQLATVRPNKEPMGQALVTAGLIAEDDLRSVLELKIRETVYETLSWAEGRFSFEPSAQVGRRGVQVAVPLRACLSDGESRAALWRAVRERIPDDHTKFRVLHHGGTVDELLHDVARGLSVREIIIERRSLPFPVYRSLAELAERGVIALAPPELPPPPRVAAAARAVLTGGSVPRLLLPLDEVLAQELTASERALVGRIDGRWDAMALLRAAPYGEADALLGLERLAARGLIAL
jgi:hypothetical protein